MQLSCQPQPLSFMPSVYLKKKRIFKSLADALRGPLGGNTQFQDLRPTSALLTQEAKPAQGSFGAGKWCGGLVLLNEPAQTMG